MNVHPAAALVLAVLAVVPLAGQMTAPMRPMDEQITLADVEVGRLVALLRLEPGMTIADVGAGLGPWTLRFAQWTGPSGHVYSTDIGDEQLAALRATATSPPARQSSPDPSARRPCR